MNTIETDLTITPAQARSKPYVRCMKEELRMGVTMRLQDLPERRIEHPLIVSYRNEIMSGRPDLDRHFCDWLGFFADEYGPRKSCISLGAGLGRAEKHLIDIGFVKKFRTIDVCAVCNEANRIRDENIRAESGDLNFLKLPDDSFDFILCHGILHHLINLEFILNQINRALTADGIAVIYEYVGEDRWQFSDSRMRVLREAFPTVPFKVPARQGIAGFESVRSSDLLPLLQTLFECERSASFGAAYFPWVTCLGPEHDDKLHDVIQYDRELTANKRASPCYHMGVYKKSNKQTLVVKPWSDDELKRRLDRDLPWAKEALESFKYSRVGNMLRHAKRYGREFLGRHKRPIQKT